ncbi:MAG: ABC transporter permease [Candidatus Saccharicenans sp.]|jgi:ABC-2 type transport system permease protein|nr:ABC transporter permease [Candidatus Saccharicenans sp.]MDH7492829.1 ABC transporter permease [Candidatus Saccharicenans sp.]
MSPVWSITKKELVSYFTSPIAYIVIAIFSLLSGFFFYSLVWWFNTQALQMSQNPYYFQQININQMVFAPLFHNLSIILLLMLPVVSMRLFSEEKKMGTEELLLTSPVSVIQIILGKYLAALIVLLAMLGLSAIPTILTFIYGNPEPVPYLLGYLGLFLLGAAFLGLGIFWSALTENQIVSAVLTFGSLLLFWVLSWAAYSARGLWQDVLNYLSFFEHFDGLTKGVLDTSDLVYYLSFAFFGLFLTHSVIQFRRWR